MQPLETVAPAFVAVAHRITWCSVATVDEHGRPRSRVLHPFWEWDGEVLTGWVATAPTPLKRAHLAAHPFVSCSYWDPTQDTVTAECAATWCFDLPTRARIWNLFKDAPPPVGYDPAMIPGWTTPEADSFAVLRLDAWRLRVFPGSVLMGQGGSVLDWRA